MPSFDVVSQVDLQEVRNAVDQAAREVAQRYDFKGTDCKLELDRDALSLERAREIVGDAGLEEFRVHRPALGEALLASLRNGQESDA